MIELTETEKQELGYLARLEKALEPLAAEDVGGELVSMPRIRARDLVNYCWAVRNFPIFDPACMSRMVKQAVKLSIPDTRKMIFEGDLWVPALACATIPSGSAVWSPMNDYNSMPMGNSVCIPKKYIKENEGAIEGYAKNNNSDRWGIRLQAECPKLPESVRRNVSRVIERFAPIAVVFEADWVPSAVKDPLVVGWNLDRWFVIDQFDLTKFEKYVAGEYCQKPRE